MYFLPLVINSSTQESVRLKLIEKSFEEIKSPNTQDRDVYREYNQADFYLGNDMMILLL